MTQVANLWHAITKVLLGEWMLTFQSRRPNGGSIVIARSLWTSIIGYAAVVAARSALHPEATMTWSWVQARRDIYDTLPIFGALFGAAYASLYSRFSSQWTYLAQLYNQIKASAVSNAGKEKTAVPLAEWKAGFIEDADDLHLSSKPVFAGVIRSWGADPLVQEAFVRDSVGGARRLNDIIERANHYYTAHSRDLPKAEQGEILKGS